MPETDTEKTIEIPITFKLPLSALSNLIVTMIEGGHSAQWIDEVDFCTPYRTLVDDLASVADDTPLMTIRYGSEEGEEKSITVTLADFKKGLAGLAASKYAWHVTNLINEDDDAITADCVLQWTMFEELIYG